MQSNHFICFKTAEGRSYLGSWCAPKSAKLLTFSSHRDRMTTKMFLLQNSPICLVRRMRLGNTRIKWIERFKFYCVVPLRKKIPQKKPKFQRFWFSDFLSNCPFVFFPKCLLILWMFSLPKANYTDLLLSQFQLLIAYNYLSKFLVKIEHSCFIFEIKKKMLLSSCYDKKRLSEMEI